jgi:hypothetical protein
MLSPCFVCMFCCDILCYLFRVFCMVFETGWNEKGYVYTLFLHFHTLLYIYLVLCCTRCFSCCDTNPYPLIIAQIKQQLNWMMAFESKRFRKRTWTNTCTHSFLHYKNSLTLSFSVTHSNWMMAFSTSHFESKRFRKRTWANYSR